MKKLLAGLVIGLVSILLLSSTLHAQEPVVDIAITDPQNGSRYDIQSDITITGTATPGSEITLNTDEGEYAKFSPGSDGNWSFTIPTVTEGSATVVFVATVKIDELSSISARANLTYFVSPPPSTGTSIAKLAQTGVVTTFLVLSGLLLISLTIWTYIDYRRHKRPLKQASARVKYTFWHHLKVVSIPLLRYRLSINLYKKAPNKSESVRRY